MIPTFPNFTSLNKELKQTIESIIGRFQPYSNFNFSNLLAWDIYNSRKVSLLNGNLVFLLSNYDTREPFLTFIGDQKLTDSLDTLLEYAKTEKINPKVRFVAQEVTQELHENDFSIAEDRDNFDYVYSTKQLAEMAGTSFKGKRRLTELFKRTNPDITLNFLSVTDNVTQKQALSLLTQWKNNKINDDKNCDLHNEKIALSRLFTQIQDHNVFITSVLNNGTLIGFGVDEILPNNYAMSHFIKADIRFKGIYEFMNEQIAKYLVSRNVKWWNWQQDLGIEGLRGTKLSYRQVHFFKKYTVYRNELH